MKLMDEQVDRQDLLAPGPAIGVSLHEALEGGSGIALVKVAAGLFSFPQIDPPAHLPTAGRAFDELAGFADLALDEGDNPRPGAAFTPHPAAGSLGEFQDAFAARVQSRADLIDELVVTQATGLLQVQPADFR
jgi:hypothetical protein